LSRAAKTIIAKHSRVPLCRRIVELQEDKNTLQRALDHSIKDYNLLVMGNKSLLSEHNELKCCCEDLQAALVKVCSDAKKRVSDLEAKVETAKAHGEEHLRDFEDGLVRKLEELHGLYFGNVWTIRVLCS
jgi:hemerythrin-like domain-containing protein